MQNTKLIILLQSFTRPELKLLRKWIQRESTRKDAVQLFLKIYPLIPRISAGKISHEQVHALIYPNRKYDDSRMRYLLFELYTMCENFITCQWQEKNPLSKQLTLLQFYREKQLDKLFGQTRNYLTQQLAEQPHRDRKHFFISMQLQLEINKSVKEKQQRNIEPNIQNVSDHLDLFYLLTKLPAYAEALNFSNISKTDYNIRFADQLLSQLTEEDFRKFPALHVHYYAVQTLLEPQKENHLFRLKTLLDEHRHLFSEADRNDLYALARNYCIGMINRGNKKFNRTLFELYQSELKFLSVRTPAEKHETKSELSSAVYKNVVTLGLRLKESKWVFKFIKEYAPFLPESQRESMLNYNLARYYFSIKNFDHAIEQLNTVDYPDFFIQLSAKALLLQSYFEQGEENAFDSLTHSFRELLRSKKKLGYHRTNYLNFIKFSEQLFRAQWKSSSQQRKLSGEIKESKEVADREWLLEKCKTLNAKAPRGKKA